MKVHTQTSHNTTVSDAAVAVKEFGDIFRASVGGQPCEPYYSKKNWASARRESLTAKIETPGHGGKRERSVWFKLIGVSKYGHEGHGPSFKATTYIIYGKKV